MKMKILLSIVLVALLLGCAKEFSDNADYLTEPPESYEDLMLQGWAAFEAESYEAALTSFAAAAERNATLPEVYLGLGWSNIRDLNLENGRIYLGSAISFSFLDTVNGDAITLDAQSGLAGIALAESEYEQAISYAAAVIEADPDYAFSHDTAVNAAALTRIHMLASFYQGDYADAFQEALDLGLDISSVIRETPVSGSVSAFTVVDSGFVPLAGDTLSTPWLKVSAPDHGLEVDDYVVISGLSDGGDAALSSSVEKYTKAAGWKIKYILDQDNFLLGAISNDEAGLVGSLNTINTVFYEGTGLALATAGSDLNGRQDISIYSGRQLVYVNSVTDIGGTGPSYDIMSTDAGNQQLQVFGNPVFTAGQRVSVDYYYTEDFGIFLSELIDLVSNIE